MGRRKWIADNHLKTLFIITIVIIIIIIINIVICYEFGIFLH